MNTQYRVLLRPATLVPESGKNEKPLIADEGTVVELMDMRVLFRNRISPITQRADEILVRYGPKGKEALGWLGKNMVNHMKPVKGPLFFIKSKSIDKLSPWGRIRYHVALADSKQIHKRRWSLVPWCAVYGEEHLTDVQQAIREFGGRSKPSEDCDAKCTHLYRLVTGQELDMAAAKKATKKGKKTAAKKTTTAPAKTTKKSKKHKEKVAASAKSNGKVSKKDLPTVVTEKNRKLFTPRSTEFDTYVIKRLQKENPYREGSSRGERWAILKKGMSVGEYVKKGGRKASILGYLKLGFVKLVTAKGGEE